MENETKSYFKNLIVPVAIWLLVILVFRNAKHLPFEFDATQKLVLRHSIKSLMFIFLPLTIIGLLYKEKKDMGLNLPEWVSSIRLTLRAYTIGGPAGMTFLLIGALGWSFQDWAGSGTLSIVYLIVFFLVSKVTQGIPNKIKTLEQNGRINFFLIGTLVTLILTYLAHDTIPVLPNIFYYLFIVGFGEELFFRGYLQSAFNRVLGRPFELGKVKFGWGMLLGALLFGLTHALVTTPPPGHGQCLPQYWDLPQDTSEKRSNRFWPPHSFMPW